MLRGNAKIISMQFPLTTSLIFQQMSVPASSLMSPEKWICEGFDPPKSIPHFFTSVDKTHWTRARSLRSIKAFSDQTATLQLGRDPDFIPASDI